MSPEFLLKLSTGMPIIDAQHHALLDALDHMDERIAKGEHSVVPLLLSKFVGDLRAHCSQEDDTMLDLAYPRYDEHHTAHLLLIEYINGLVVLAANPTVALQIIELVRTTLVQHVEQFDMSVAYFAHNKDYFSGIRYAPRGRKRSNLLLDLFKKEFANYD